jgi:hypothetical protein
MYQRAMPPTRLDPMSVMTQPASENQTVHHAIQLPPST